MSFRLGPDGKPIEVETSYGDRARQPQGDRTQPPQGAADAAATKPNAGTKPPAVDLFNHLEQGATAPLPGMRPGQMAITPEPPTRPVQAGGPAMPSGKTPVGGATIPPAGMAKGASEEAKTTINFGASKEADAANFVCGWLVIIDGPGKGKSLTVGAGQSAISRSPSERIAVNFGDTSITSKQQLLVLFDDEMREFFVAPGNGSSLNRLNGQIIGTQMPLKSGDVLKVGATTMRFVAFCDAEFSWS